MSIELIYYIVILVMFGAAFVALNLRSKDEAVFSFFLVASLAVFFALREFDVGQDTASYLLIFAEPERFELFVEPGFIWLNKAVKFLGGSERELLFVFSLFIGLLLYLSYRSLDCKRALLCLALFACTNFFWLFQIQVIRNGMAAALFLLALSFMVRGKDLKFWIAGLLSISLHYTAALPVFLAYGLGKVDVSKVSLRIGLAFLFFSLIFSMLLYVSIPYLIGNFDAYYTKFSAHNEMAEMGESAEAKLSFFYLVTTLVVFGFVRIWGAVSKILRKLFVVYAGLLVVSLIFWDVVIFRDRLFYYVVALEPVFILAIAEQLQSRFALCISVILALVWGAGIVFVWGPLNILTHY